MDNEVKKIKLESVYKDAYIDRYRRLGYTVSAISEETDGGKSYANVTFERDRSQPAYKKLAELEEEVDELCIKAREQASAPDEVRAKRRHILLLLLCTGGALIVAGCIMTVSGLLVPVLGLAIGGWLCAVAGAAIVIVWSCLREKWRLRRVDVADDISHPGFGVDMYSKKVEECLKQADELRAQTVSD